MKLWEAKKTFNDGSGGVRRLTSGAGGSRLHFFSLYLLASSEKSFFQHKINHRSSSPEPHLAGEYPGKVINTSPSGKLQKPIKHLPSSRSPPLELWIEQDIPSKGEENKAGDFTGEGRRQRRRKEGVSDKKGGDKRSFGKGRDVEDCTDQMLQFYF